MWPETEKKLQELMDNMREKAAVYERTVQFGLEYMSLFVKQKKKPVHMLMDYCQSLILILGMIFAIDH